VNITGIINQPMPDLPEVPVCYCDSQQCARFGCAEQKGFQMPVSAKLRREIEELRGRLALHEGEAK